MHAVTPPAARCPGAPLRFLLDVHLGTLARRLRLLGVDAAYENEDIGDPALATLLGARAARDALAGPRPAAPPRDSGRAATSTATAPTSNCATCWGGSRRRWRPGPGAWRATAGSAAADKDTVRDRLEDGTQKSYDVFARCTACDRVYWKGAHHAHLEAVVEEAMREFGPGAAATSTGSSFSPPAAGDASAPDSPRR